MEWSIGFFIVSIALGISLAMDAFSVSLANGLNEPNMKVRHNCGRVCFLPSIDANVRLGLCIFFRNSI